MQNQPNPPVLTPRQIAGRLNHSKRKGLSAAGRQRLREAAKLNRPWKHATGPRTLEGKRRSAANGRVRQIGSLSVRQLQAFTAEIHEAIEAMRDTRREASEA